MLEQQTHPFKPYFPQEAKALIIGTAPPWNFCTKDSQRLREGEINFFYGSIHNLFWYVIKSVFEPTNPRWPRTRLQCESFLKRHQLAMGDILHSFTRQDRKASDDHLSGLEYNFRLLDKLTSVSHSIEYLYFSSQFASDLFLIALKKHGLIFNIHKEERKFYQITLQKKRDMYNYSCYILSSPSPRINRSLAEMLDDYRSKFSPCLGENAQT